MKLTEREQEYVDLRNKGMSQREISNAMGVHRSTVQGYSRAIANKEVRHPDKPRYLTKGISELKDAEGNTVMTWYKSQLEMEALENQVKDIVDGLHSTYPPIAKIKKPSLKGLDKDLQNCHIYGDPHINMVAWGVETGGKNWDMDIAIDRHMKAMLDQIQRAPPARTGLLAIMGDLFHSDSDKPYTANSENPLDMDGRTFKAYPAACKMIRWMVDQMLGKYESVSIVIVPGNHSPTLEKALSHALTLVYEKEKRVTILDNRTKHIPHTFGKNFILFTHGDKLSAQKKADLAVGGFRHLHGTSNFTHVITGHLHHHEVKELSGCRIEIVQVLPTADAWHYNNGYITADQAASVLTYHSKGGIVNRTESLPRIYMGEL